MFAMINRLDTGLFVWVAIGVAIGYVFGLFGVRGRGPKIFVPMAVGLAGALVGGLGLGLTLNGYHLWECNVAAVAGACLFSFVWQKYARPRAV